MGRAPCCDKANVKKGPWSPEEDAKLKSYIDNHGTGGNWIALPNKIGLKRCGKSCRLRWLNYLRPNIKHGGFTQDEDNLICSLYVTIGSRWSIIAAQLPGRTDNDIKNYWNTRLKKKLLGSKPVGGGVATHEPASNQVQLMLMPHHQFANCFEAFDDQLVSWAQHDQLAPLMINEGDDKFPGGFEETTVYPMPHGYSGGVDAAFSTLDTVRFGAITSENANWTGEMINTNYVVDTYPGVVDESSSCDDRKMRQDCWMTSLLFDELEPRLLGH